MNSVTRLLAFPAVSLCLLLAGCASDDGYGGYGGNTSVAVGVGYGYGYPGGYYPYYPPGYGCCWDGNGGRPPPPPPGRPEYPDRPTTLPAGPGQLPAERPNRPTTQPAHSQAHPPSAQARTPADTGTAAHGRRWAAPLNTVFRRPVSIDLRGPECRTET